ncbi:hypothetical protein [Sporosarcina sp. FSL K6-1508]|uniref:hypothetical protein n=1 Tax=Sporosarcina sp. FSL K6-1508 TaxID=2921553 RepID=UPI0030F652ED
MDFKKINKRQIILQLALQEAFRKRDECQIHFDQLDKKLSTMTADGCSFNEKDKVVESMTYLKSCRDDWQESIDHIREWQDELKI